jgi:hypothetical protein
MRLPSTLSELNISTVINRSGFTDWFSEFWEDSGGESVLDFLLTIGKALLILLIGWIIARIVRKVLTKGFEKVKLEELAAKFKVDVLVSRFGADATLSGVLSKLAYWVVMLIFIAAAVDALGWTMMSDGLAAFFAYLPTLLFAVLIFIVGMYLADIVRRAVLTACESIGISGAKTIANIAYYVLVIFIAITALNQAGMDTSLITSNLTVIFGSILLAFAISYGIASRNIVGNLLSSYYSKGRYKPGQRIKVNDVEGVIEKIDSISVTVNTGQSKVVFPSKKLIEDMVEIISEPPAQD